MTKHHHIYHNSDVIHLVSQYIMTYIGLTWQNVFSSELQLQFIAVFMAWLQNISELCFPVRQRPSRYQLRSSQSHQPVKLWTSFVCCCWTYHLKQFSYLNIAMILTFSRPFKNIPVCTVLKTTPERTRNVCACLLYKFIIYITLQCRYCQECSLLWSILELVSKTAFSFLI